VNSADSLAIAKAGRIVRVGTKGSRATRIVRIVRMVRLLRLFRIRFFTRFFKQDDDSKPNKLGLRLADQLGKRVVVGTISLLLVVPLLEVISPDTGPLYGLEMLHDVSDTYGIWKNKTAGTMHAEFKVLMDRYETQHGSNLLQLVVNNQTLRDKDLDMYRLSSLAVYDIADANDEILSAAVFLTAYVIQEQAVYNILLTLFIIVILGASAFKFNQDVRNNVVKPIEKTTRVIRKLASTLFLLSQEDAEAAQGEHFDVLESDFIQKVVGQLNTFFAVGKATGKRDDTPHSTKVHPGTDAEPLPHVKGTMSQKELEIMNAIPESRIQVLKSMHDLWKDPQGVQYFKVFLSAEFAVESLLFVTAVDQFKAGWHALQKTANDIVDKFVHERAESQVNISDSERSQILKCLKSKRFTLESFDEGRHEIFTQLERDNFPRFLKSELCSHLIDLKKKQTKEFQVLEGDEDSRKQRDSVMSASTG